MTNTCHKFDLLFSLFLIDHYNIRCKKCVRISNLIAKQTEDAKQWLIVATVKTEACHMHRNQLVSHWPVPNGRRTEICLSYMDGNAGVSSTRLGQQGQCR